jgi:hypothetical protein
LSFCRYADEVLAKRLNPDAVAGIRALELPDSSRLSMYDDQQRYIWKASFGSCETPIQAATTDT